MGAHLIVTAGTRFLQLPHQDSPKTEQPSTGEVGGGVGLSVLRGLLRFELRRPLSPNGSRKLRFNLTLGRLR
jgi:hypothetical protein